MLLVVICEESPNTCREKMFDIYFFECRESSRFVVTVHEKTDKSPL